MGQQHSHKHKGGQGLPDVQGCPAHALNRRVTGGRPRGAKVEAWGDQDLNGGTHQSSEDLQQGGQHTCWQQALEDGVSGGYVV